MAGRLQLTEQLNPMAQTFRVTDPLGSVITKIGLFFERCSTASEMPITLELRPVVDGGNPSSQRFIPGTRVSRSAADVRSTVNTAGGTDGVGATFGSSAEVTFTFREPVYIPGNTEVAIVAYTAAPAGQYKVFAGTLGEYQLPSSNTIKVTHQLDAGVFFQSANGTVWSKDQNTDIAFKVYRAVFNQNNNFAKLRVPVPPVKRLTENRYSEKYIKYPADPIILTENADSAQIIHPAHGFQKGDTVQLSGLDSSLTYGGINGYNLMGDFTILKTDPYGYTIGLDSSADSTGRFGGTSYQATEQYVINDMILSIPHQTPPFTDVYASGKFTSSKSFGGTETAGADLTNVKIPIGKVMRLKDPQVVLSAQNEAADSSSTFFDISLNTEHKYVAPYINGNAATLVTIANFIDYQDSASEDINNDGDSDRNTLSTISFVAETQANGGTTASKHMTIPFVLEDDATSIRVMMDARRPEGSDFSVWYRTAQSSSDSSISNTDWTEFSKTINPPNKSNYSQNETSEAYNQYEFNVFDIESFDTYQVKITFNSQKSSNVPTIRNLRTIATV